jgi:hypothetical protein
MKIFYLGFYLIIAALGTLRHNNGFLVSSRQY